MSIEAVAKALTVPGVTKEERLTLIGIANHDGDGGSWPSVATLAGYGCCGERAMQERLRHIEARGWVTIQYNAGGTASTPNDRRPNRYLLNWEVIHRDQGRGAAHRTPEGERGAAQRADGVQPTAPEPSLEPSSITSVNRFTVEAVMKAARKIRDQSKIHKQTRIMQDQAERLTAMDPQPPIQIAAFALLGEDQSLRYWLAEQEARSNDDESAPRPVSGAAGIAIAEAAKQGLRESSPTGTVTP